MFNDSDSCRELMKYLDFRDILTVQKMSKFHYGLINEMIDSVDENQCLQDDGIAIINKLFELHLNYELDFNKISTLPNFAYHFKVRQKHGTVNYAINNVKITINVKNILVISGCKSHYEAVVKVNDLLKLFYISGIIRTFTKVKKLKEISTTVRFQGYINSKKLQKCHSFHRVVYSKHLIFNSYRNGQIDVYYDDFRKFYLACNYIVENFHYENVNLLHQTCIQYDGQQKNRQYKMSYHILVYGAIVDEDLEIIEPFQEILLYNKTILHPSKKFIGVEYEPKRCFTIYQNGRENCYVNITLVPKIIKQL